LIVEVLRPPPIVVMVNETWGFFYPCVCRCS